jgi:hypothetical protein
METFLTTTIGIIIGLLGTAVAGHYYFKRSLETRLTAYVLVARFALLFLNESMRSHVQLLYHGAEVEDLFELQLIIVNNGTRSIRECIEPLQLLCAPQAELLEAEVIHVHPTGRRVSAAVHNTGQGSAVTYRFPLLNAGEYFVTKLLFKGKVAPDDLSLSLVAEDLPPKLELMAFPRDLPLKRPHVHWDALLGGLMFYAIALAWSILLLAIWFGNISVSLFSAPTKSLSPVILTALLIATAGIVVHFVLGTGLASASGMKYLFKRKPISLPPEFSESAGWAHPWIDLKRGTRSSVRADRAIEPSD